MRIFISTFLLTVSAVLGSYSVQAQNIIWANRVVEVSSQAGENGQAYSATQALKAPDALPQGQLSTQAWSSKRDNSTKETLLVSFPKTSKVRHVVVVENFNPGAIIQIELLDTRGTPHTVYVNQQPGPLPMKGRSLTLNVPYTTYRVAQARITLNCAAVEGQNQIDAIGITESEKIVLPEGFQNKETIAFKTEVIPLPKTVNTRYTEVRPLIAPNGKILYFSRQNHPKNMGGDDDEQDIWYSTSEGNHDWTEAKNMNTPLNTLDNSGVCSVTPDGNTLLLINTYNPDGSITPEGASITYRTKTGWSFPIKLIIQDYYNRSKINVDYCLSNNSQALIMSVKRDDGRGDQDLYVSFQQKYGLWSAPINLGSAINTDKAEFAPFLASDNKTLYFASEGHGGYGKSDIFYTKRLDDTWTNWSKPLNMGPLINSSEWDGYYSLSAEADYAYFVSTKNAIEGSRDIFRVALEENLRPEPVMLITGKVYDEKTNKPIGAKVVYETLEGGVPVGVAHSNPVTGEYNIVLPKGTNYGIVAEADGYIGVKESISVSDTIQYSEVRQDLKVVPFEVGEKVRLNNIFFAQGQYYLRDSSIPELKRLLKIMREYPSVEIVLEGHTDNQGDAKLNLQLSLDRVNEVKKYLVSNGIEKRRIQTKGWGGAKPLSENTSEESRRLNRRVEFVIIKI